MANRPVLGFDTSAAHCAAALLLPDGRVLNRLEAMEKGQAERLIALLDDLLTEGGIGWSDLAVIGVGTGPGNFTGVRLSVAAARGLALGLGIPAVGVTRLEALAHGLPRPLLVAEDARRDEIYAQIFYEDDADPARLIPLYRMPQVRYGTGSAVPNGLPPALPLAEAIARIAQDRAEDDPPRPAPFYLRGADAAPPADPPPTILP